MVYKNMKRIFIVCVILFLFNIFSFNFLLAQPLGSTAETSPSQSSGYSGGARFGLDDLAQKVRFDTISGEKDARKILFRILRYLLGFTSIVAVAMVLYGGFLWTTSGGNDEKVQKGKNVLKWAVIGIIIITSAWGIISTIMKIGGEFFK